MWRKHWEYAKYITRHKWFVFLECCRFGMPLVGIIHDWSKLLPDEWGPYAEYFNGGWSRENKPGWVQEAFDQAWLKHQRRSGHHWQAWILRNDDGGTTLIEMPKRYRLEMIADWRGAGRVWGFTDAAPWYQKNADKIMLGPNTRRLVEEELLGGSVSRLALYGAR